MNTSLGKETKNAVTRKTIYVDMGGVLMDFHGGLELVDDALRKEYAGRYREIPHVVSYMPPIEGAVEAMRMLKDCGRFDVYILSTSPWENPTVWSNKVEWINRYLDSYYRKRLIQTHHKNLLRGDYIIDDRGKHGTAGFKGEWIQFGSSDFPNWDSVLKYLNVEPETKEAGMTDNPPNDERTKIVTG